MILDSGLLFWATLYMSAVLIIIMITVILDAVVVRLCSGANVNASDTDGDTCLHMILKLLARGEAHKFQLSDLFNSDEIPLVCLILFVFSLIFLPLLPTSLNCVLCVPSRLTALLL